MNPPIRSKINYTALLMAGVGLLAIFDVIPADAEGPIIEITLILGPVLVATFRTWFTSPKEN